MTKLKKDGVTPKNSGGKRREGVNQEPMTFKISKENKSYLVEKVGNKNAYINMLIRADKEKNDLLIAQIDKILSK